MTFAMVFPGQGSQSVGMLATYQEQGVFRSVIDEASAVLGYDVQETMRNDPQGRLNQTDCTQPVLLAASVAVFRCWLDQGGSLPALMAGHSLGEFTALVCAGVLDFADGLKLVAERGRQMQAVMPAGTGLMAAVLGLDDSVVEEVCSELSAQGVVQPVNYNMPGQVVIAGEQQVVELAMQALKVRGAKRVLPLQVSVPAHSALMRPAAAGLEAAMQRANWHWPPKVPILHNIHARTSESLMQMRAAVLEQLSSPVQWVAIMDQMQALGITLVVECGPAKVLCGLTRKHEGLQAWSTENWSALQDALSATKKDE